MNKLRSWTREPLKRILSVGRNKFFCFPCSFCVIWPNTVTFCHGDQWTSFPAIHVRIFLENLSWKWTALHFWHSRNIHSRLWSVNASSNMSENSSFLLVLPFFSSTIGQNDLRILWVTLLFRPFTLASVSACNIQVWFTQVITLAIFKCYFFSCAKWLFEASVDTALRKYTKSCFVLPSGIFSIRLSEWTSEIKIFCMSIERKL